MIIPIIQITSIPKTKNNERFHKLKDLVIPKCVEISEKNYFLVSPISEETLQLKETVESLGGKFIPFTAWEKDMSRKWREGINALKTINCKYEWICFLADDMFPDDNWVTEMEKFLDHQEPGQYGFRLTDLNNKRHEFGEDWMQFANPIRGIQHRSLNYDITTGEYEDSPTSYVAACVVHKDVIDKIEPFGLFGNAPDVMWSMAIKQCGYKVGFNPKARVYHFGDRSDNR